MEFKIKNPTEEDNKRFDEKYQKYFGQESHKDCAHCNAQKEYEEKRSEQFKSWGVNIETINKNNYKFNEGEEEILSELFNDLDDERPEVSLLDLYLDLFDPELKERIKSIEK